jgi:RNA 2',3'-cyclic 3'-phosphodiesterase
MTDLRAPARIPAVRLFFAIMLPPDIQAAINRLRQELTWLPIRPSYTAQHNLHITLKFLGEVPDAQVASLADEVSATVHLDSTLQLCASHVVFFPADGPARVLGIGFTGDTHTLCQLQSDLEQLGRRLGFPTEKRPYTPHATIARFRDGLHARHRPRIEQSWQSLATLPDFRVNAFQLMQSTLSSSGSQYTAVATFSAK